MIGIKTFGFGWVILMGIIAAIFLAKPIPLEETLEESRRNRFVGGTHELYGNDARGRLLVRSFLTLDHATVSFHYMQQKVVGAYAVGEITDTDYDSMQQLLTNLEEAIRDQKDRLLQLQQDRNSFTKLEAETRALAGTREVAYALVNLTGHYLEWQDKLLGQMLNVK